MPLGKASKGSKGQPNHGGKKGGDEVPASISWSNEEEESDDGDGDEGWTWEGRHR